MSIWNDPHRYLGLQEGGTCIRLWRPDASTIHVEVDQVIHKTTKVGDFFELKLDNPISKHQYRVFHSNGMKHFDPYSFLPTIGEVDLYLFKRGVHYLLYEFFGSHICTHEEISGVRFSVWAPNAVQVFLVGDFNFWDGRINPMRNIGGVWEIFIPGLGEGEKYKFEILTPQGDRILKSDPFATRSQVRPETASVVCNIDSYFWNDSSWMSRRSVVENQPLLIYEVHLGSWKKKGDDFLNYRELAPLLSGYVKEMGFTHVELLPICEHPLDESWGYQVSGFYAPTSRFGSPQDFQFFVDFLHQAGIGIILDWVPAHFPVDPFALARFDGTALYEHEDPKQGFHPHWNTLIFNYGRFEVSNFLIASALFWLDKMHIDGIRVDAVASMLYLDYGRNSGEWIPNIYGGHQNLEAIEFLKHLNSVIREKFPTVLMIAEESTSFPLVTGDLNRGGLGFHLKWNMGWMNDTLHYFQIDPFFRRFHHQNLTFGLLYAFSENFTLVLSHDEVVHGKKSLLSKMAGDHWQKFANLRLLYSYMICQIGKKLLFMGGEFGQWSEWNAKEQLCWNLLEERPHKELSDCIKDLNRIYLSQDSLWRSDLDSFKWVDFKDEVNSVISYLRFGGKKTLLCIHHFTPTYFANYSLQLGKVRLISELFSTDRKQYGGSDKLSSEIQVEKDQITFVLPPLATVIFEVEFENI